MIIRRRRIRIEIEQQTLRVEQQFGPAPLPPDEPEASSAPAPASPGPASPGPSAIARDEKP
jgi:hypothetical protein